MCFAAKISRFFFISVALPRLLHRDIEKFLKGYGRIRNISVKVSIIESNGLADH